jgi:hypothetical protein
VNEYVATIFTLDETITFFCIKPLNFACHFAGLLKYYYFCHLVCQMAYSLIICLIKKNMQAKS